MAVKIFSLGKAYGVSKTNFIDEVILKKPICERIGFF